MPVPKGARVRTRTLKDGRKQRLVFFPGNSNTVIESTALPKKRKKQ